MKTLRSNILALIQENHSLQLLAFQEFSQESGAYRFDVELLNDYVTVCGECGLVRKDERGFRLFQANEVPVRWTYVAVSTSLIISGKINCF